MERRASTTALAVALVVGARFAGFPGVVVAGQIGKPGQGAGDGGSTRATRVLNRLPETLKGVNNIKDSFPSLGLHPLPLDTRDLEAFRPSFLVDGPNFFDLAPRSLLYALRGPWAEGSPQMVRGRDFQAVIGARPSGTLVATVRAEPNGEEKFGIRALARAIGFAVKEVGFLQNPPPVVFKGINYFVAKNLVEIAVFSDSRDPNLREDKSYPSHVLFLVELLGRELGASQRTTEAPQAAGKNLRGKFRTFQRHLGRTGPLRLVTPSEVHDFARLPFRILGQDSDVAAAHGPIARFVGDLHRPEEAGIVARVFVDHEGVAKGLYVVDVVNKDERMTGSLATAITQQMAAGATEWMDVTFFRFLAQNVGIRDLFLGGSETVGVHRYVQKLSPMRIPYRFEGSVILYDPAKDGTLTYEW